MVVSILNIYYRKKLVFLPKFKLVTKEQTQNSIWITCFLAILKQLYFSHFSMLFGSNIDHFVTNKEHWNDGIDEKSIESH